MDYRLPYYMAYPMPLQYDDERIEQRDFEYMKSMYPETAKRLLPYVEDECDRMAYEGSVVYDEYPDGSTGTYGDQKTPERGLVGRYDSDYGVSGVIPAKVRS